MMARDGSASTFPTLLYDGGCGVCAAFARVVAALEPHRLRTMPFQEEAGRRLLRGWTEEQIERSAHLVLPDGEILSGAAAFAQTLDLLPVLGPLHRRLSGLTPLRRFEEKLYGLGAVLRRRTGCASQLRRSSS
ncbi:MAG: thiol-disulfide oxidoreductase DCC family protein [Thermoplasmata archaeon]